MRLSDEGFLLKRSIRKSLDYLINKNALFTVEVLNLRVTVTTHSNLSLKKVRQYVYRIMWIQGNIWVLNLSLIYHRIYRKKLTSGFSKTRLYLITEAVVHRCSVKKMFLEISKNSQENTCARVSSLIKKRLWHLCFPVSFAKFPRTPFLTEHLWWLLLWLIKLTEESWRLRTSWVLRVEFSWQSY